MIGTAKDWTLPFRGMGHDTARRLVDCRVAWPSPGGTQRPPVLSRLSTRTAYLSVSIARSSGRGRGSAPLMLIAVTGLARTTLAAFAIVALASPVLAEPCPAVRVGHPAGNYIVP